MTGIFSTYKPPFSVEIEDIAISIVEESESLIYKRESKEESLEKILLNSGDEILINPIEPVNLPKNISPFLLIDFEKTVVIDPRSKQKIFLRC